VEGGDEEAKLLGRGLNKGDVVEKIQCGAKFSKMRCRNRQIVQNGGVEEARRHDGKAL
jgi:hypothetical protein